MAGGVGGGTTAPIAAPGIIPPLPSTNTNGNAPTIPFRAASDQKTLILDSTALVQTTAVQQVGPTTINGEGFIEELGHRVQLLTAGNSANVAYTEDGKRAILASIVFNGPGGDVVNTDGITQSLANEYDGKQELPYESSADVSIQQAVTGTGGTGGTFTQLYRVPMAIGYRNLVGLLGNQDRATKYRLRNDLGASATIYSVIPNAGLGTATITRYYTERVVPANADNFGNAQVQVPASYGIIHYMFSEINATTPAPGAITHYIQGLGNVWRRLLFVFRQNGSRSSAESTMNVNNAPTAITFFLGDNPLFTEDIALRRRKMYDRYGYDAPNGVLVYDWANDFALHSGEELGDDYLNTQNLVNLKMTVTYPSGIGTTNNTLTVYRDSLFVPAGIDLASVML